MKNTIPLLLFCLSFYYIQAQNDKPQEYAAGKALLRDVTQYPNFSVALTWMNYSPARITDTDGPSSFYGINMNALQVAGYYTKYALPYLGIRTGIVVGEQPLDYVFAIQGATIDSQRIDYSATQEPLFGKEYLFYAGIPLLLELRLPLSTHFQLTVNSGVRFDYYFPKLSGSMGWVYLGYPGWDSLEMVKVTIPDQNGVPDQKIFTSFPVSVGIDYVLPNFNTLTAQLFETFSPAQHFKAPYIIFQGTDEESRGIFSKNGNAVGLQILYTFSGYHKHNKSSAI